MSERRVSTRPPQRETTYKYKIKMRKIFLLTLCLAGVLCGTAQTYVSLCDTVWGCRYFAFNPSTGQPSATGQKASKSRVTWPSTTGIEMRYYVMIPKGYARADMYYTPRYGKTLTMDVTVTDPNTGEVVYEGQVNTSYALSTSETSVEIIPATNFPSDTWYQIKLVTSNGNGSMTYMNKIIFQHESDSRVVTPSVFMAPSAHNNSWTSTDPDAPSGNTYDWVYGEFLYPDEYAFPNRYLMCLGASGYYSGIQVTGDGLVNKALFSAWDNGDTDVNPNLPEYLRSGAIDNNSDVTINRFGNEGTGVQSMLNTAHWQRGHWVQWLLNARPETTLVTLTAKDGSDSIITYANTILTAWYKMEEDPEWHYISTVRQSGTTKLFGSNGEYSFLENYTDHGGDNYVRGYMRNRFYRSSGSGKWYSRNHMTASHYNYNDGDRDCRYDYGHGAATEYDNCFYIEQGGFGQVNDASMYVPLATNTECVDTIDIDEKYTRINQAFRTNYYNSMVSTLDSLYETEEGQQRIMEMAQEYIADEGQIGGFSAEATALLEEAYGDGSASNLDAVVEAFKEMSLNYNEIRYANVTTKTHIGSQRAYVLQQTGGLGLLYAEMVDGTPTLRVGERGRDDMNANWMIMRSDKYGTTTVRNIGLGLYLNFDSETLLSEESQDIAALGRYGSGYYLGHTTSEAINVADDGTVSVGRHSASGSQFYLHDNLSFTPTTSQVEEMYPTTEASGIFDDYKAMVPQILSTPEGVLGSWTNAEQLEELTELYDDGNITIDKATELITLIDGADKISLDDNTSGAFIITAVNDTTETGYLTIDADNYLYRESATNKPDQVWFASPKNGGHELSSQGRALSSLSDNINITVNTKDSGEGVAYYPVGDGNGQYTLSNIQYGPTVLSTTTSPVKTATSNSTGHTWYLTPATEVKFSLNSAGTLSLYLDFDVLIPEGLKAYKVMGFDSDGPLVEEVLDTIHARTPVILSGTSYGSYLFQIIPEQNYPTETSLMQGTLLKLSGLKSQSFYTVTTKSGKPTIALSMSTTVNANQCYILKEDMEALNLTESQYEIDFGNILAAKAIEGETTPQDGDGAAYDLLGRPANEQTEGIIIHNNRKTLNRR